MSYIQSLIDQAWELHRAGDLDAAEPIYSRIIEEEPDHADALNLLGTIMLRRGGHEKAIDLISRAVAARPEEPRFSTSLANAWCHRGIILESIRREDQATDAYRLAIENM